MKYEVCNELRVVVDNSRQPDSRWYSGAGIYRPVWLWTGDRARYIEEDMQYTRWILEGSKDHKE